MFCQISRREALRHGLGAAGLWAGHGLPLVWGAETPVDRSQQAPASPVAIQRCESYQPQLVRQRLDAALDAIGGIKQLVNGKTVAVKLNLTGRIQDACGRSAHRTYHTHPNVTAALCGALADAGANEIVLVESFYYKEPPEEFLAAAGWDVAAIKSAGGQKVTFENTRNRGQWPGYSRLTVPWGGFLYPAFDLNQRYEKTDVFVSLAKLKDHGNAGVTVAVKNLFGITPLSLYGSDAPNEDSLTARVKTLHLGTHPLPDGVPQQHDVKLPETDAWKYRVPRATADQFGARPVDLAVIDGIETVIGGEGPWMRNLKATEPKLLLAGRNAVCVDSICAAVMGYNPQAEHMAFPFPGENHLRLLASVGVGTNDVAKIEVAGLPLKDAMHPFRTPPAGVE
jgi:uncharacterized protein (DUF362 family)